MGKERTTVSVEGNVLNEAREHGLNISTVTEKALQETMKKRDYYFINSNKDTFDDPEEVGTGVYKHVSL